jgi:alpha-D-ribose 1-methylphosphonate 5-triphosphate synthase subunit PhnG
MSVFGNMMSKIFGHAGASGGSSGAGSTTVAAGTAPAQASDTQASPGGSGGGVQSQGKQHVDVAAVLDGLASTNHQRLDWKHSIVDMMKLLDMDSSLSARKELASELHYSGDTNDSASMNIWLHKQVMQKLAENGGKVPDELRH